MKIKEILGCFVVTIMFGSGIATFARAEITKAQAISRARAILRENTTGCRIKKINSVSAVRVRAGWRVTAQIVMAASGSPISERAVWIISQSGGAVAQDQLTAEIESGCP